MSMKDRLLKNQRFQEFMGMVQAAIEAARPNRPSRAEALRKKLATWEERRDGYKASLGVRNLSNKLRTEILQEYDAALEEIDRINGELQDGERLTENKEKAVDADEVVRELEQLASVLEGQNASAANLMLAQHIDRIECDMNGVVRVRTCALGAMWIAKDLLAQDLAPTAEEDAGRISPRRLTRRDVGIALEDDELAAAANEFAAEPDRFGSLGPEWFAVDEFQYSPQLSWAAENAVRVAEYRLAHHATREATAAHFDKSGPTITAALKIALEKHGIDALGKAVSQPARVTWPMANATAIVEYLAQPGRRLKDAAAHFKKSEPTIQKARDIGQSRREGS